MPGSDVEIPGTETTSETTYTGTVSVLGVGASHQKTETTSTFETATGIPKGAETTVNRSTNANLSKGEIVPGVTKNLTSNTKLSIAAGIKIELLYEND